MPRRTALVVLAPEADAAVGHHRLRHDANAVRGVPAHVTLLFPFRCPVDDRTSRQLVQLCRGFRPFEARFSSVGRFPGEVVWLRPEPAETFAELLAAAAAAFPDRPPYGGTIADPIPHLTVGENVPPTAADELVAELIALLPVITFVSELSVLLEDDDGRWVVGPAWPLGRAGATSVS